MKNPINKINQPRSIGKNHGYSWEIAPNNQQDQHDTRQPFAILSKRHPALIKALTFSISY